MKQLTFNKYKIAIYIMLFFGISFFFLSPLTLGLRGMLIYQILFRVLISITLIYLMVKSPPKDLKKLELGIFLGIHILIWGSMLPIDTRTLFFIFMGFSLVSLLLLLFNYFKTKTLNNSLLVSVVFVYIIAVYPVLRITPLDGKTSHFWQHALGFGVLMAVFAFILIKKYPRLVNEKQDEFFAPILALMIGFFVVFLSLNALNYTLDRSDVSSVEGTVLNKDVDSGYRTVTSYELTILLDNDQTISLNVSQDVYQETLIGDTLMIHTYQGFLNIPYYIYEPMGN